MLDVSIVNGSLVGLGFVRDNNVSVTQGFNGKALNAGIAALLKCPRPPISQKQFDNITGSYELCKGVNPSGCEDLEYIINQYLKIDEMITSGQLTDCNLQTTQPLGNSPSNTAQIIADNATNNIRTNQEINLLLDGNGQAGLGTLLLPFLYIRWGDKVLHNSFPSYLLDEPTPQIKNNVTAMEITIETGTSGGEESGGSGSTGAGLSTCELTLNPHLVDNNGKDIIIEANGAELLVIYGYPNSSQVRVHTFAQVGISDEYFNSQSTKLSFRGKTWKLSRLQEQRRYPSGNLRERVIEVGREICRRAGYKSNENECEIIFSPEDALNDTEIGETVQSSSLTQYLTKLVEKSAGCSVVYEIDGDAYDDIDRGKYKISITCENSIKDENEPETNLVLVDRALWLGQGLAETVTISDVGDSSGNISNTGGSCGNTFSRNAIRRPKNVILKSFDEGCDYQVLNRFQLTNTSADAQGEFLLRLEKDGSEDVPILSPFAGEVIDVGPNPLCASSDVADNACHGPNLIVGSGNFITIKSNEPGISSLNNITWSFYHIASSSVNIGDKITPGQAIATQGSSGSAEVKITGIRIERNGTKLPESEGLEFLDDYIQTLTFECKNLRQSCSLDPFITSGALKGAGGAPYHLHIETRERGVNLAIEAFDNMAGNDSDTCYNLNIPGNIPQTGNKTCWNSQWEYSLKQEVANKCWDAHKRRPSYEKRFFCDFYIFSQNFKNNPVAGRNSDSAKNRSPFNPYPDKFYTFFKPANTDLGAFTLFFEDENNPATLPFSAGDPNVIAQLIHGDLATIETNGGFGEILQCNFEDLGDGSDNEFLENTENKADIEAGLKVIKSNRDAQTIGIIEFDDPNTIFGINLQQNIGPASTIKPIVADLVLKELAVTSKTENTFVTFSPEIETSEQISVPGNRISIKTALTQMLEESGNATMNVLIKEVLGGLDVANEKAKNQGYTKTELNYFALKRPNGRKSKSSMRDMMVGFNNVYKSRNQTVLDALRGSIHLLKSNGEEANKAGFISSFVSSIGFYRIANKQYVIGVSFANNTIKNKYFNVENQTLLRNTFNDITSLLVSGEIPEELDPSLSLDQNCGSPSEKGYPNMDNVEAQLLNEFCKRESCNPKDIAAFIQAECNWDFNATNGCFGAFQCCPGQAPEASMKQILEDQGFSFFNDCSSLLGAPLEQQLVAWKAYKEASIPASGDVPISGSSVCQHYVQIALPALVRVVSANYNANFKDSCISVTNNESSCRNFYTKNSQTWFLGKSFENALVGDICKYAVRSAIDDPRLDGGCTFSGRGTTFLEDNNRCSNSSVNRALNARNTGTLSTGGLRNVKFRQEIRLNAEFGICPRNIFLSPVDPNGKPMYILLANMDNSAGFADFKIRSVTLSWQGHFRWSVTAFRPADSVNFETPPTLNQPRSLNEWISYYWFLDRDFIKEANQFSPPDRKSIILSDGTLDPDQILIGNVVIQEETSQAIDGLFGLMEKTFRETEGNAFSVAQSTTLLAVAQDILNSCRGQQKLCINNIENLRSTDAFEIIKLVDIEDPNNVPNIINLGTWVQTVLINPLAPAADSTNSIR